MYLRGSRKRVGSNISESCSTTQQMATKEKVQLPRRPRVTGQFIQSIGFHFGRINFLGQSKIKDFHITSHVKANIIWFQITIDHTV